MGVGKSGVRRCRGVHCSAKSFLQIGKSECHGDYPSCRPSNIYVVEMQLILFGGFHGKDELCVPIKNDRHANERADSTRETM